jgi:type VI secretion system protein ImpI
MPLRLQVVSAHRESMGGSYIQEFAACGGTIGRSLDCEWPLPDSKRYISSKHAMIDYQSGAYYLVDLSRNGVYINGANVPVGKGNPQRLFDGDLIRLGEFDIQVAIIEDASEGNEDAMRDSVVRAQLVPEDGSAELTMLAADQMSDHAPMDAMLTPGDSSGELSGLSEIPLDSLTRLAAEESKSVAADLAAEFLKAAGANPDDFGGVEPRQLIMNAGRLLSAYTEETHELLVSNQKIGSKYKLKTGDRSDTANPLRSAEGLSNALRLLLSNPNDVSMTGTAAIKAAFKDLIRHQQATVSAMQSALADYLSHFEPEALEQHFSEQQKRTGADPAAFREAYAQAYAGLAQRNDQKLPKRFDEEFSRAYEIETADES